MPPHSAKDERAQRTFFEIAGRGQSHALESNRFRRDRRPSRRPRQEDAEPAAPPPALPRAARGGSRRPGSAERTGARSFPPPARSTARVFYIFARPPTATQ